MSVYLRPETAQGIFVNYLNVQKTGRMRIPFGIAQIGKAFRNEIVARQFIFRMNWRTSVQLRVPEMGHTISWSIMIWRSSSRLLSFMALAKRSWKPPRAFL